MLFQDAGYVNSYERHDEESIAMASSFLEEHDVNQQAAEHVSAIIASNKLPQDPKDKIAECFCDAGMSFIAFENGLELFDLLYDETALQKPNFKKRSAYEKEQIDLFTKHTYFTEYGKQVLQPLKEATLQRLSERMNRRKITDKKSKLPKKKAVIIPAEWIPCPGSRHGTRST